MNLNLQCTYHQICNTAYLPMHAVTTPFLTCVQFIFRICCSITESAIAKRCTGCLGTTRLTMYIYIKAKMYTYSSRLGEHITVDSSLTRGVKGLKASARGTRARHKQITYTRRIDKTVTKKYRQKRGQHEAEGIDRARDRKAPK